MSHMSTGGDQCNGEDQMGYGRERLNGDWGPGSKNAELRTELQRVGCGKVPRESSRQRAQRGGMISELDTPCAQESHNLGPGQSELLSRSQGESATRQP